MTAAANGRIRRSVRFAQMDGLDGVRQHQGAVRRQRITVADHLASPSFQHTQDWTGGMGVGPSGRFQVVEDGKTKNRAVSRKGIRQDWARILLLVMLTILIGTMLAELAAIGASRIQIQKLNSRIAAVESRNQALEEVLAQQSGDISVCTEAVKLNLVSSGGVRPISLTAPTGARMTLVETNLTPESSETHTITAAATGGQGD
ncbi:MAG: hypothetical protein IJ231_03465 [Clostridia bacterium]|nr:hypothetical protein [Clostridia bacterium]